MTLETLVGVVGIGVFTLVVIAGILLFQSFEESDADADR